MAATVSLITVGLNPAVDRLIEVPGFALGGHQRGRLLRRVPAGKSINVSSVLAALGVPSTATGFLGRDNRAEFDAVLSARGIGNEFLSLPGRTRENITILDPLAGRETHIREAGLTVGKADLRRLASTLQGLAAADSIIVFSGSAPPGVGAKAFARLLDACAPTGARLSVDTSGEALAALAGRGLWLVKPNAPELSQLVGRPLETREAQLRAARTLSGDVRNVLLTCGADGAYLVAGGRTLHARLALPPGAVANTVGCGDVLLAAFLAGTCRGLDASAALAEAVATAAASACALATAEFDADLARRHREHVELAEL